MINDLFGSSKKKRILIVDFSAVSHSVFHAIRHDPDVECESDLIDIWRHTLLLSLITRKSIIKPDEMVIGIDYKSWRKDYFKYYKAKRKDDRLKSDIDFDFFYKASDKFIQEITDHFPWIVIKEKMCEGDDVLAILATELSKKNDIVLMSSDKDLLNLVHLDNVKFYSYRNNQYETLPNPKEQIIRHILFGDTSDGIPNVKSVDNCFVSKIRQKSCGPKTIDKILEQGIDEFLDETGLHDNYKRNKTLIELSEQTIPKDLWKKVVDRYYSYDKVNPDFMKVLQFLNKNKLTKLQERTEEFLC